MKRQDKGKEIIIKEDVRIPGTNIILEKGDKIIVEEGKLQERKTDTVTFYAYAASAIINGDYSGVDRQEQKEIDMFWDYVGDAEVVDVSEPYFGRPEVGSLPRGEVADYTIMY